MFLNLFHRYSKIKGLRVCRVFRAPYHYPWQQERIFAEISKQDLSNLCQDLTFRYMFNIFIIVRSKWIKLRESLQLKENIFSQCKLNCVWWYTLTQRWTFDYRTRRPIRIGLRLISISITYRFEINVYR